jgi:integrase
MADIFKKISTRPLPNGATVTKTRTRRTGPEKTERSEPEYTARWTGRDGKTRTAAAFERNGSWFVREESSTWFARYRDGGNVLVEAATGCRDEGAARAALGELTRQAERIRAGLLTPAEDALAREMQRPFQEHVDDYLGAHRGVASRRAELCRYLKKLATDLSWHRLVDLDRSAVDRWLTTELRSGRSARSVNAFREAALAFCNWLVRSNRLGVNPLAGLPRANQEADRRHIRRAFTPDELDALVRAAKERPVRDYELSRRGKNRGLRTKRLSPVMRAQLERLGLARSLIYRVLATTGLRRGELARLKVGDLELTGPRPCVRLRAATTKNRRNDIVPLRDDVRDELRSWTAGRRPDELVFCVRGDFIRVLDADLQMAGIKKEDERGRILDVHSLRLTFGTWLARAGVPLTTAQKLMRHSDPKLTANVYCDVSLLDLHGAVSALPLASDDETRTIRAKKRA